MAERASVCPVYHMWYPSSFLTTTGRFTSFSQPVSGRGPRTILGGPSHANPFVLSTIPMLAFGRHETHIQYALFSRSTATSKHVPYCPPKTGFPAYLTHPATAGV